MSERPIHIRKTRSHRRLGAAANDLQKTSKTAHQETRSGKALSGVADRTACERLTLLVSQVGARMGPCWPTIATEPPPVPRHHKIVPSRSADHQDDERCHCRRLARQRVVARRRNEETQRGKPDVKPPTTREPA